MECSICLYAFADAMGSCPRVLACGHSYCESCLAKLINDDGIIACPSKCSQQTVCVAPGERGVLQLPKNWSVCASLTSAPMPAKPTAGNSDGQQQQQQQQQQPDANLTCPQHPEKVLAYWCTECRCLSCADCAVLGAHQGHKQTAAAPVAFECRNMLQSAQRQWTRHESDAIRRRKGLRRVQQQRRDTIVALKEHVDKAFKRLHRVLNQRRDALWVLLDEAIESDCGGPSATSVRVFEAKVGSMVSQASALLAAAKEDANDNPVYLLALGADEVRQRLDAMLPRLVDTIGPKKVSTQVQSTLLFDAEVDAMVNQVLALGRVSPHTTTEAILGASPRSVVPAPGAPSPLPATSPPPTSPHPGNVRGSPSPKQKPTGAKHDRSITGARFLKHCQWSVYMRTDRDVWLQHGSTKMVAKLEAGSNGWWEFCDVHGKLHRVWTSGSVEQCGGESDTASAPTLTLPPVAGGGGGGGDADDDTAAIVSSDSLFGGQNVGAAEAGEDEPVQRLALYSARADERGDSEHGRWMCGNWVITASAVTGVRVKNTCGPLCHLSLSSNRSRITFVGRDGMQCRVTHKAKSVGGVAYTIARKRLPSMHEGQSDTSFHRAAVTPSTRHPDAAYRRCLRHVMATLRLPQSLATLQQLHAQCHDISSAARVMLPFITSVVGSIIHDDLGFGSNFASVAAFAVSVHRRFKHDPDMAPLVNALQSLLLPSELRDSLPTLPVVRGVKGSDVDAPPERKPDAGGNG